MEELIIKLEHDIKVNERCLKEEVDINIKRLLRLWISFDEELLEIIRRLDK